MRAYVLIGGQSQKEKYISEFVQKNHVMPYYIYRYTESLKILEAKDIKKKLAVSSSSQKLFIIESVPTLESQNALLKTIEELPEDADFMFLDGSGLLPTVVSRCTIINLEPEQILSSGELETLLSNLLESNASYNLPSVMLFVDKFSEKDFEIEEIERAMREIMFKFINTKNYSSALLAEKLLKKLIDKNLLIKYNNLNKRLVLETIFLNNLR